MGCWCFGLGWVGGHGFDQRDLEVETHGYLDPVIAGPGEIPGRGRQGLLGQDQLEMPECGGIDVVGHVELSGEPAVAASGTQMAAAGEGLNPPPFWQMEHGAFLLEPRVV